MKKIDYGFENGLVARRVVPSVDCEPHRGEAFHIATPEEMQLLAKEPYSKDHVNEVVEQLENPRYVRSLGGVGVEAAVFGDVDSNKIKIIFYGWGGDFRHPHAQGEAMALAYADPNAAFAVINGPGVGNSGMLPKSVREEIRKKGSYLPMGEYLGPAVDHIAQDYDRVMVGGHSLGARTATAVAANIGGSIDELRLHDPTGTHKMNLGGIAYSFACLEGYENFLYNTSSRAPSAKELELRRLPRKNPSLIENIAGENPGEFKPPKRGWIQQFLVDPAGLSKDAFGADLLVAASSLEGEANIFVPDSSHLNDWRDVAKIVGLVRYAAEAKINLYTIEGHTHSNMNQAPSLATIYTAQLP